MRGTDRCFLATVGFRRLSLTIAQLSVVFFSFVSFSVTLLLLSRHDYSPSGFSMRAIAVATTHFEATNAALSMCESCTHFLIMI